MPLSMRGFVTVLLPVTLFPQMVLKLDAWAEDSCRDFLVTQVIRHIFYFPHNPDSGIPSAFTDAIGDVVDLEANEERVAHLPTMPLAWEGVPSIGCSYEANEHCCVTAFFSAIQGAFPSRSAATDAHAPGCSSCPESNPRLLDAIPALPVGSSSKRARSPPNVGRRVDPLSPTVRTLNLTDDDQPAGDAHAEVSPTADVQASPCQCCPGCMADVAAHFQGLLNRNVVLDKMSLKDLQFACWLLVNKAELSPVVPTGSTADTDDTTTPKRANPPDRLAFAFKVPPVRREHLLSHLRSLYYDRLLARRKEPKPAEVVELKIPEPTLPPEPSPQPFAGLTPLVRPPQVPLSMPAKASVVVGRRELRELGGRTCELLERQLETPGQPLEGWEGQALSDFSVRCLEALNEQSGPQALSIGERRVPCTRSRPPFLYRQ